MMGMDVSVSLWSIIHSYDSSINSSSVSQTYSFRLLMEYHSFLYKVTFVDTRGEVEFPSPYGVIFILIWRRRCK